MHPNTESLLQHFSVTSSWTFLGKTAHRITRHNHSLPFTVIFNVLIEFWPSITWTTATVLWTSALIFVTILETKLSSWNHTPTLVVLEKMLPSWSIHYCPLYITIFHFLWSNQTNQLIILRLRRSCLPNFVQVWLPTIILFPMSQLTCSLPWMWKFLILHLLTLLSYSPIAATILLCSFFRVLWNQRS